MLQSNLWSGSDLSRGGGAAGLWDTEACLLAFFFFFFSVLAVLGLHCCLGFFSSCSKRGLHSSFSEGFLLRWLLLLQSMGSRCEGFSRCSLRINRCGS